MNEPGSKVELLLNFFLKTMAKDYPKDVEEPSYMGR
jgi:hypothetical protein